MKRILVIEDEAIIRLGIVAFLKQNGFTAISASNGYLGISLALEKLPDLILCNVRMAGLSGYEVFRELRNNPATTKIPFLFLTAQNIADEFIEFPEIKISHYLTKPYNPQELLQAIKLLIGSA